MKKIQFKNTHVTETFNVNIVNVLNQEGIVNPGDIVETDDPELIERMRKDEYWEEINPKPTKTKGE